MAPNAPFFIDQERITLSRNGIWWSDEQEITHEPTRRLFAKSLQKDANGYFLKIGRETKRIEVEDTAYFVQRIEGDPQKGYELFLSDETQESLEPQTLNYHPGRLTCRIKKGEEEAKFLHSAYIDLLKHLQEDSASYYLELGSSGRICRVDLALRERG